MADIEALRPEDIVKAKEASIPDAVIEVFNELIVESWNGSSARILQKEAYKRIVAKGIDEGEIYKRGWLDIEDIFREKGWKVQYDKPAYCESYEPYFIFSV